LAATQNLALETGFAGVYMKQQGAAGVMTKKVLVSLMALRLPMWGLRFGLRYGILEQFGLLRKLVSGWLVEISLASYFDIKIPPQLTSISNFSYRLDSTFRIKSHFPKLSNFIQTKSINMSTIDKVKHALHLDKDKSTTSTTHHNTNNGVPEGTAGPHSTRVANAADPRVDSDLDSSRTGGTTGIGHTGHGTAGGYTGTGSGVTGTQGSTTAGPHSSNMANK
jgi:hypothetical protein